VSRVTHHTYVWRYPAPGFAMARYIQKLALLGRERWIGWEIDGVGTEVPGLALAEGISEEELRAHGVMDFSPMPFESFLGLGAALTTAGSLLDEDIEFRLDALQVGMERFRKVDGGIAVACSADELGALGAREQKLQALGRERLVVGDQHSKRLVLNHWFRPGGSEKP